MAQPDPSSSVPQELMPHVHLVSSYRYPTMAHLDPGEVAKWLMGAPQIARDRAPFFWTYLERPADGSIFLTWQPVPRLGNNFASDGFIWLPPEQLYKHDLGNGLMLEIYYHKAGFAQGDQFTTHTRRRFRLVPVPGHPNPPQPDISLFIVHYAPAEPNDRIPTNVIPVDERMMAMMQQRNYLLKLGHIRRKEFMLSDRVNWPSLPELTRQQVGPHATPRGVPQQMAYPPQAAVGPPAKRARHAGHAQAQQAAHEMPDDDEDTWRGDIFDHSTPREISLSRYQQNHEWMEEILSSPYRIGQITPVDLGLGLKGELASLTEGIFSAQGGDAFNQIPEKPYVGRLDDGQADEFRKRVDEHIKSTEADIEKMRVEYAKSLSEFKENSVFSVKEKELRSVTEGSGPEFWRVEGWTNANDDDARNHHSDKSLEDVVKDVESAVGRTIESRPMVNRVQDGGYLPPAPEPAEPSPTPVPAPTTEMSRQPSQAESQASGVLVGESDIDMGNTAAGLLDQMHTGFSATSTPVNNFPTPQPQTSNGHSNAATPSGVNVPSPSAAATAASQPADDIAMGDSPAADATGTTPDQETGSGDWVVVPKSDATAGAEAAASGTPADGQNDDGNASAATKGASSFDTPAVTEGGASDQNDFSSLGDLDTAGDALAGYDAPALDGSAGELGEGLDLNMDMEDSAFGDAFHGVEAGGTPGDGNGHDM